MEQIYDFERNKPPVLNENMLRAEQERRKKNLQTVILMIAAVLMQLVFLGVGYISFDIYPWVTAFCINYVIVSVTGGSVLAIVYSRNGGFRV